MRTFKSRDDACRGKILWQWKSTLKCFTERKNGWCGKRQYPKFKPCLIPLKTTGYSFELFLSFWVFVVHFWPYNMRLWSWKPPHSVAILLKFTSLAVVSKYIFPLPQKNPKCKHQSLFSNSARTISQQLLSIQGRHTGN